MKACEPMVGFPKPHSLGELILSLEALCARNHGTEVSVEDVVNLLGPRSFAPIILAVGLIAITPIDSVPTLPTTFGAIVFLTACQMLLGRQSLWLPRVIARRAVPADRLKKALKWLEPYGRKADNWLGTRLTAFTDGPFLTVIALSCALLALTMPLLELAPLVSTLPALGFAAFGVSLLMRDGVAAIAGIAITIFTLAIVAELARLPF